MKNLVKQLKREGVPIDGVGIQAHLVVGEVPTTIQQNIEEVTALGGIVVAITELDIRFESLPASDEGIVQQKLLAPATPTARPPSLLASLPSCAPILLRAPLPSLLRLFVAP